MINSKIWVVPAICMLLLTSGCGDDDSSGSGTTGETYSSFNGVLAEGGGLITGFGSVIIDGVTYQTTGATIEEEDRDGDGNREDISADSLAVGMRVDFEAKYNESDDTGFLSKLLISDQVSGLLQSADVVGKKIYIFGDEILFNDDTVFANFASENLETELLPDVHVSVSGYRNNSGVLTATLIRKVDASKAKSTIEGPVANFNDGVEPHTFEIRGIPFSYADPEGLLANNKVVRVTFTTYKSDGSAIAITDLKIPKSETRELVADRQLVMRGPIVTADGNNKVFTIGNVSVKYDGKTTYQGGEATDLSAGTIVLVKGTIVVNEQTTANALAETETKALQAREIMFHKVTDQFIEGKITAITTAAPGKTITVGGKQFELTKRAQISNKNKNKGKKVFDSLAKDDVVAIGYYATTTGGTPKNIVTKLKRLDTPEGFDADTVTYKATLNDLAIADDDSTITYKEVQYKTAQVQILDQFGNISTVSDLKGLKTSNGAWNVLLTVKKGATAAQNAVLAIEVKAPATENIVTFVTKITHDANATDTSFTFTIGTASLVINNSSTEFSDHGGKAHKFAVGDETATNLTVNANDSEAFTAILEGRKAKDVIVKITGIISGSEVQPKAVTIYQDAADFLGK